MKFVTLPVGDAAGALLAHALARPGLFLPKGHRLDQDDLVLLRNAGVETLTAAVIEDNDVPEDRAAERLARALVGTGLAVATARAGRCDLTAAFDGLLLFEPDRIHALNRIHESITLATLPPLEAVEPGQTVATIKINPFAVQETLVAACEATGAALSLAPFLPHRVALIQTTAPGLKASLLQKTTRATRERLRRFGSALCAETFTPHEEQQLATEIGARLRAGADLILICGASSTADRRDVVPAAIVAAGGAVECFGMPVEPGNLLVLGRAGGVAIVGMPGCARTAQLNGFDFISRLLLAGRKLGREDIAAMGVGGLLRGRPNHAAPRGILAASPPGAPKKIAAIVLAAGQSRRMGANKLTMELDGRPMLGHALAAITASRLAATTIVLGHEADRVRAALGAFDAHFVINDDFRAGLSTSLKKGLASLPPDMDGAMIFLGDMPDIDPALIDRMIDAFDPGRMQAIIVPKRGGRQGHPVLWGRGFFPILLQETQGDSGAKHLIGQYADWVEEIEADHEGVLTDLDTPDAFARRQNASRSSSSPDRKIPAS